MVSMWVLTTLASVYSVFAAVTILWGNDWVAFTYPGYERRFLTLGVIVAVSSLIAGRLYAQGKAWPIRILMLLMTFLVARAMPSDIFDKAVPQAVWLTPLITFALLDMFWLVLIVALDIGLVLFFHGDRIIFHNLGTVLVSVSIGVFLICARYISDKALEEARQEKSNAEQANQALSASNAFLEVKVAERTADLSRSNTDLHQALEKLQATQAELMQANKVAALGKLVAKVAHELNTPVGNAMLACSGLVAESVRLEQTLSQAQVRKSDLLEIGDSIRSVAHLSVRNLERIAALIEEFKDIPEDSLGEHRTTFELGELVQARVNELQSATTPYPVRWQVDIPHAISMQSFREPLVRVVQILLDNALQHGVAHHPEGEIHVEATQPKGQWITLRIWDNGHGIAESDLQRVFEPLFTSRLADASHGLGLYIAYKLVRNRLGGQITVSNQAEGGLRVEVVLPACAPDVAVEQE